MSIQASHVLDYKASAGTGVGIRDAMLSFNILYFEEHSEPNCRFSFSVVPKSKEESERHRLVVLPMSLE